MLNSADALDAILPVSRETKDRLAIYVGLLEKWQKSQNLIAPGTLNSIWTRHVADSVQALAAVPDARRSGFSWLHLVEPCVTSVDPSAARR